MERPWPLTGRDDQLRAVAAAIRPGAAGIVVAGPAGVGKTRLAREALAARGARGASFVWAHGSQAARPVPLGAFAGVIDLPAGDAASRTARMLALLARRRPAALVVDDAHQLDEHSAIVLHRVVDRALAPVLVTLRSGETAPDPVVALWKDHLLPRLELEPLGSAETASLVARVLGGPVDSASVQRLWRLAEGSPLFLRHLLDGEVDAGRFTVVAGVWRWSSDPELTPALAGLLEQQIGRLPPGLRDVVDLIALAEPVAIDTLVGATSADDVEDAEDRGLIRTDAAVARLAHPLYGETRRRTMGTLRARRLRGVVARTLDGATDPLPTAVLTLESDLAPDPALFLRAAEEATRLYDLPLAERLGRAAAASGDPRAQMVHAAALSWLSRGDEAETILAGLAARAADPAIGAMAHLHRAGNLLFTLARPDAAARALDAAEATGALPVHVAAMSVALSAAAGDVTGVLRRGPELLRGALPDDLARILVASGVAGAAAVTADLGLLAEAARVGGLTADRVPTVVPAFGLADFQVLGHRLAGTPHRAVALTRRLREASEDLPGPARSMGLVVSGHAALAQGRVSDALVLLRQARAALADTDHEFRFRCRTLLVTALGQAGLADEAGGLATDLAEEQHPAYRLYAPDDLLARAWAAAAEGARSESIALATAAADLAAGRGQPAHEVLAWQTVVQFGEPRRAEPALERLARLGPRAGAARAHARALAGADAEALVEVAHAWQLVGDSVAAGDAAAQAAALHRRQGRTGSARFAAALAAGLAERSGARTPACEAMARPLPLSTREREIATLAARGRSNAVIAAHLGLSVRTVEGHLYRAGHKLGVSDRASFAAVLGIE